MAKSDFGEEQKVTSSTGVTYDLNKDYTKAINKARASGQDTSQLEAERQAKINSAAYGGAYKEGAQSATMGTGYNALETVQNRNSNAEPIVVNRVEVPEQQRAQKLDTTAYKGYLDQWLDTSRQQATAQIDRATEQSVNELARTQEDAQAQFQTQQNQIDRDEALAKDNQALYAAARGDRGGIAQSQYDSVMNTAAQNRMTVRSAQTKMATDVGRQMAELRGQGEYQKADALLQLTQQYLGQLMELEQWAAQYNLSVDQFNASLDQWAANYNMQLREMQLSQEQWNAQFAWNKEQAQNSTLSQAGYALLKMGVMPSASQLASMGLSKDDAGAYIQAAKIANASKKKGTDDKAAGTDDVYQSLYDNGIRTYDDAYQALRDAGYNTTDANRYAKGLVNKIAAGDFNVETPVAEAEQYPINVASVINLGIGPRDGATLRALEEQGIIESYVEDGKLNFRAVSDLKSAMTGSASRFTQFKV